MTFHRNVPLIYSATITGAQLANPGAQDGTPVATIDLTTNHGQRIFVAATIDPGVEAIARELINALADVRPRHTLGLLRTWADAIDNYLTANPDADPELPDTLDGLDLGPDGR